MRRSIIMAVIIVGTFMTTLVSAMPTVYPTGTTIYKPDKAWNGYTVFPSAGKAGYGSPTPGAPRGLGNAQRDYSRVIEFDPITLEINWRYSYKEAGYFETDKYKFYSQYISAAQRLPNGNTLITEGADGRLIEITADHEIVWEYISPYFATYPGGKPEDKTWNMVYRAYRVPYEWVPQLKKPMEKAVTPPSNWDFTVPGTTRVMQNGAITKLKENQDE